MSRVSSSVYAFAIAALAILGEVVLAVAGKPAPSSLSVALYAALGGALGISLPYGATTGPTTTTTVTTAPTTSTATIPRSG